ncbi:MAG TPA: SMC-Scp complex subunit ScpB [Candidatus Paceibacterota bacterium]
MKLENLLEAILFHKSEPVNLAWLAKVTKKDLGEINQALAELEQSLQGRPACAGRGVVLVKSESEVSLGTHPEAASVIREITKYELSGELGKASLETISIILYQSPISRSSIEYIRGVNSQFTIRHLLIRGLIERVINPNDSRSYLYQPTLELLKFMGLSKKDDLPDYESIKAKLNEIASSPITSNNS